MESWSIGKNKEAIPNDFNLTFQHSIAPLLQHPKGDKDHAQTHLSGL